MVQLKVQYEKTSTDSKKLPNHQRLIFDISKYEFIILSFPTNSIKKGDILVKRVNSGLLRVIELIGGVYCVGSGDRNRVAPKQQTLPVTTFTVKSKESTAKSKDFTAKSKDFTVKSKDFTAKSKDFTAKSKDFTAKSKESTAKSKESTAKSKESTAKSKDITVVFSRLRFYFTETNFFNPVFSWNFGKNRSFFIGNNENVWQLSS
ncbi:MAG: hypothetical protein LBG58_13320 [Planctomycetaceae bacterium]|jgi:hypothetical protein|nr:hypothetical protein [Planctomycetaceae bacterium]